MNLIRVYDPRRAPANWSDLIRPGQFVAFPSDAASGVPCDVAGRPSREPLDGVCVLFDTFAEAEAWWSPASRLPPPVPRLPSPASPSV